MEQELPSIQIQIESETIEKPLINLQKLIEFNDQPQKESNEQPKGPNLFLSSEEGTDQFAANFISESEKSLKNETMTVQKQAVFVCEEHRLPITVFCEVHFDYLCEECKKEHLSHVRSLKTFEFEDLKEKFLLLENRFSKVKNTIVEHQKSLKMIIDHEKNNSEEVSMILRKICHFLSKPIMKTGMSLRKKKSKSLIKTSEKIKERIEKDKDREKDKEKEKEKYREKDKEKDKEKDQEKDKEKDKEKVKKKKNFAKKLLIIIIF